MATHDANIENLRTATLGEQVRGSMIQLFEEDYNLVKRGISVGTDVTSASSSTTGYYDGNVYINSTTLDVWKLINNVWTKQGNLKGISNITSVDSFIDDGFNVITFTLTDGTTKSFNIKNGSKGSAGASVTGVIDNGDGTFSLTLSDGTTTGNVATIKGDKGDKGDAGATGATGATGRGLTSITSTDSGKNHVLSANFTDGTSNIITTLRDGNDGAGTGDMLKATYDRNDNGIVDVAEAISDGTRTLTFNDVDSKANKSTTLSGYGITDAYTNTEVDTELAKKVDEPATEGTNGQALVTDGNGGRTWATVATEQRTFTLQEWEDLPQSEKNKYDGKTVAITDDYESNICSSVQECIDSTSVNDVAGASVVPEIEGQINTLNENLIPKDITSQCVLADGITTLAIDVYTIGKQVYINGLFKKTGDFAFSPWTPLITLPNGLTSGKAYSEQGCGGSSAYNGDYADIEPIASSLHLNTLCIYKSTTPTKSIITINRNFKLQ